MAMYIQRVTQAPNLLKWVRMERCTPESRNLELRSNAMMVFASNLSAEMAFAEKCSKMRLLVSYCKAIRNNTITSTTTQFHTINKNNPIKPPATSLNSLQRTRIDI